MVTKSPPPLGPRRRAVGTELKDRRRGEILAAALQQLERQPYETLTMSGVATAAGVAKGTLYLYFPTRESLFLSLLGEHYAAWFDALDARLQRPGLTASGWADWITRELAARPLFLRLVALLHAVLEQNVPLPEALAFKRQLAQRVGRSGIALERALRLPAGAGSRLLLWLQAIVPGLAQLAAPAAPLRAAVAAEAELAGLLIDFATEMRALLAAVVRGLQGKTETAG
ncbi:MAG: TetR family transcriptional regulator [Xanthomonadaceae bacterium]|nr:TetR family transcriptional regulator [Xanthomonadaceae bacterium]MDE3071928.1 TetR family transcriptional regulator [Pseudomonadota bacterium]